MQWSSSYALATAAVDTQSPRAATAHSRLSADDAVRAGYLPTASPTAKVVSPRSSDSMGGRVRAKAERPDYASWKRGGRQVIDLAASLGFPPKETWDDFWFFTLCCAYELKLPLEIAEDSAWRLLRASYDKLAWANET